MLALLKDQENSGCFRKEVNDIFDQNDLHKLNLYGFIPPKVDSHAMSSEPNNNVFLTPIIIKSTCAKTS